MGSSFEILKRRLFIAGLALAVAHSAQAQQAGRRPGEAILFSSPDEVDTGSNAPSPAAKPPALLDFANTIQSPAAKFDAGPPAAPLPAPQPQAISPAQAQQMQQLLDERQNWMLLTPEEILGLTAQGKIPGIPDGNASGQPEIESVVARFYENQQQLQTRTNNDIYAAPDSASQWNDSGGQEPQMNPNIWAPAGGKPENPTLVSQFLNGKPGNPATPAQASESGWSKSFNLPAPPPDLTPEQEAAVQQFQQLLQPHSSSGGAAKAPFPGSPFFSPSSAASVPQSPAVIPIGASFTPLSSGVSAPAGVTPLPGRLGPTTAAPALFAPEWKPQAPPWESSAPQLGEIPQRKF